MNPEIILTLAIAPLLLTGFAGAGGLILQRAGHMDRGGDALRLTPIALAAGFSVFSYFGYILAAMAPLPGWVVVALALGATLAGAGYWRQLLGEARSFLPALVRRLLHPVALLFGILCGGVLTLALLKWLTPPTEGDALAGYLFTARWLFHQGLTYCPYNPRYSLMPSNTELVFALSFPFDTDLIAKFIDGFLGLIFVVGVYELARRHVDRLYAFSAAASLVSMRAFIGNWSNLTVNTLCAFVFFCGFSLFLRESQRPSIQRLLVPAFLVGTACSQKYTIWVFAVTLPFCVLWIFRAKGLRHAALAASTVCLVLLLLLVPHMVKATLWAHNPVAPFAEDLFPSQGFHRDHGTGGTPMTLADVAVLPKILFFSSSFFGQPFPLYLLFGLPLFLLSRNKSPTLVLTLAAASAQVGLWVLVLGDSWLVPRFLLAPIALLLVVAAAGVQFLCRENRLASWLNMAVVGLALWSLALWPSRHWRGSADFVLGRETRTEWHAKYAPGRGYPVLQKIAGSLGPERRLFIDAGFYNLPHEALPYINTEEEYAALFQLPAEKRVEYLRAHGFALFYSFSSTVDNYEWLDEVPIYDQFIDPRVVGYKIYQLAP